MATQLRYKQITDLLTGWYPFTPACTYASATTFTITGDYTSVLSPGMKLKLTNSTLKYFYVVSASYGAPNTTVTITGGTSYTLANAAITGVYLSRISNPQGFPQWFNWTPTITYAGGTTDPTSNTINHARFSIVGRIVYFYINSTVVRGSGDRVETQYTVPVTRADTKTIQFAGSNFVTSTVYVTPYANTTTIIKYGHNTMTASGDLTLTGFYEI